jgi:hypothetical protein
MNAALVQYPLTVYLRALLGHAAGLVAKQTTPVCDRLLLPVGHAKSQNCRHGTPPAMGVRDAVPVLAIQVHYHQGRFTDHRLA